MKLFQYSVIHLYSGRERRLTSVNQLSLKICNPLNFKSRTATGANDTKINVVDVLMGLKAKSSTFREFCENMYEILMFACL